MKISKKIRIDQFQKIVFFTGAGMSAESGIPTYRGGGGIWDKYRWDEYACQEAFDTDPEKVLEFHHVRQQEIARCQPNIGHRTIAEIENKHPDVTVVTQNIDGKHQQAGSQNVIELHGNMWRMRCDYCQIKVDDLKGNLFNEQCKCGRLWRPDIIYFGDMLDQEVIKRAVTEISSCDLFISIGTSGVVWPAAGFPQLAKQNNAKCLEINLEYTEMSMLYDELYQGKAGEILPGLFE